METYTSLNESYEWSKDLLKITQKIVNTIDQKRSGEICRHFECDLSDFREWLSIPRRQYPITNADIIRAMTDEELADRIMVYIRCDASEREFHIECNPLMTCRGVWLEWLKQEVET